VICFETVSKKLTEKKKSRPISGHLATSNQGQDDAGNCFENVGRRGSAENQEEHHKAMYVATVIE
jgi:hypothetical protein